MENPAAKRPARGEAAGKNPRMIRGFLKRNGVNNLDM